VANHLIWTLKVLRVEPCLPLIQINLRRPTVEDTAQPPVSVTSPAGLPLTEQSTVRFVVGTFDSWPQLRGALHQARAHGLVLDSFNCLALQRLFAGKAIVAPDEKPVAVEVLPFVDGSELMACTVGPLADCLKQRIASGARTLKEALSFWVIPRHAAHFEEALQAGKILLWIKVADAANERYAFQALLAHSSNTVGVHDLSL
jgi:hypothetical protein